MKKLSICTLVALLILGSIVVYGAERIEQFPAGIKTTLIKDSGNATVDGNFAWGGNWFTKNQYDNSTTLVTIFPETYSNLITEDGNDTPAVVAALAACPDTGCHIKFSCRVWTFNLVVDKSNVWLDGCGAASNTYWVASTFQASEVDSPVIKVDHVTSGATYYPNTGFQLTNAHLNGVNSDGIKYGKYGIHIRSAEYFNLFNVNVEYFDEYQLLLGDSDLVVGHDWVYFGNYVNTTWKAHQVYTTGDTIKLLNSGSQVTSQYFANTNLYGPGASGGYAMNNVTNVRFTGGYFQIPADGHGLYKNASVISGTYDLANITVEGNSDTDCVVTSTHTSGNSYFSVLETSNVDFTGSYCDGNGVVFSLDDVQTISQGPRLYDAIHGGTLHLIYGGGNQTSQTSSSHSVFIRRGYDGLYWDDSLELYGTQGVMLHATPASTHPALTISGSGSYGLSMTNTYIPLYMQLLRDDNGSKSDLWPVARYTRMNSDIYTSYGSVDGFGTYIDLRLATMNISNHFDESAAGRYSWYWDDSDSSSLDSALGFSIVGSGDTANKMSEVFTLREGTAKFYTPKTLQDISVYFKNSSGTPIWANVIRNRLDTATAGAEDTSMDFNTMKAGSSGRKFGVTKRGILFSGFTPSGATDSCQTGEFTWDNATLYSCVTTDYWKKSALSPWGSTGWFGGTTHYSEFETDGTLEFHGDATVWDDLRIPPSSFDFAGAGDPSVVNWQPGGSGTTFRAWEFQNDDSGYFTVQIPHGYKNGSNIYAHVHWTPGANGNEEAGKKVDWKLDYSWANIGSAFTASSSVDMNATITGTDHIHEMSPSATITGTSKEISSMLVCKIYRGSDAQDTWAGTASGSLPLLLEVDFHFEMDTVGSRGSGTK